MMMVGVGLALLVAWRVGQSVEAVAVLLAMGRESVATAWEEFQHRGRRTTALSPKGAGSRAPAAQPASLPSWAQAAIEAGDGARPPHAAADALRRHVLTWAATALADIAWRHPMA